MQKKTKQLIKEMKAIIKKCNKEKEALLKNNDEYGAQVTQYQIDFHTNCLKELEKQYKKEN